MEDNLRIFNHHVASYIYPINQWDANDPVRQFIALYLLVIISAAFLYLLLATLSYVMVYNKNLIADDKKRKSQIRSEIKATFVNMPQIAILTTVMFWLEVRGYSKLYDSTEHPYSIGIFLIESVCFIFFTDMWIYFIHFACHCEFLYNKFHKVHHYTIPTPYASHAMHWVDSFLESFPYHLYVFLFPMHKVTHLGFFLFVNIWTISVHDGFFAVPKCLKSIINSSAHHSEHHRKSHVNSVNYGQFFTLWDRLMSTYYLPDDHNFKKTT